MCTSTPSIAPPPPPVQAQKMPDTMASKRKSNRAGVGAGSLLTGPSGIANNALPTGGTTLLGG